MEVLREINLRIVLTLARLLGVPVQVNHSYFKSQALK